MKTVTSYQCLDCDDIIRSKHVHDFVTCMCYRESKGLTGFAVDGGNEYLKMSGNFERVTTIISTEGK